MALGEELFSTRAPADLAPLLNVFYRAAAEARAQEAEGRARGSHEQQMATGAMQLDEARRLAAQRAQRPQDLASLVASQPEMIQLAAQAPREPAMVGGEDVGEPGAAVAEPGAPGLPGVNLPGGQTLESLTRQLGPEAMARLMEDPVGQSAIKAKGGIISNEELTRRQRLAEAKRGHERFSQEAQQALIAGDSVQYVLKMSQAWHALGAATQDPEKAKQFFKEADSYRERADKLQRDKKQRALADGDAARLGRSVQGVRTARDAGKDTTAAYGALVDTYTAMESDEFRKIRDAWLDKQATREMDEYRDPKVREFATLVARKMAGAAEQGMLKEPTPEALVEEPPAEGVKPGRRLTRQLAIRQAAAERPDLLGPVLLHMMYAKGKPDQVWLEGLFGDEIKVEGWQARVAKGLLESEGLSLMESDPARGKQAVDRFMEHLTRIIRAESQAKRGNLLDPADRQFAIFAQQEIGRIDREVAALNKELAQPAVAFANKKRAGEIQDEIRQLRMDRQGYQKYVNEVMGANRPGGRPGLPVRGAESAPAGTAGKPQFNSLAEIPKKPGARARDEKTGSMLRWNGKDWIDEKTGQVVK